VIFYLWQQLKKENIMNFGNLKIDDDVKLDEDTVGGGSFTWESGVYDVVVDMAYLNESKGGAMGLTLTLLNGKKKLKETLWITSGKAKGQKSTYIDQKGTKRPLPGYTQGLNLCMTAIDSTLEDAAHASEAKTINIYNFDAKKEQPTNMDHVMTNLIGKQVKVGVIKRIENKRGNDGSGKYIDLPETREVNVISQFFYADSGLSVMEKAKGETDAKFITEWKKVNDGNTHNRVKKVDAVTAGQSSGTKKLFG
jgi:hypothetical protein